MRTTPSNPTTTLSAEMIQQKITAHLRASTTPQPKTSPSESIAAITDSILKLQLNSDQLDTLLKKMDDDSVDADTLATFLNIAASSQPICSYAQLMEFIKNAQELHLPSDQWATNLDYATHSSLSAQVSPSLISTLVQTPANLLRSALSAANSIAVSASGPAQTLGNHLADRFVAPMQIPASQVEGPLPSATINSGSTMPQWMQSIVTKHPELVSTPNLAATTDAITPHFDANREFIATLNAEQIRSLCTLDTAVVGSALASGESLQNIIATASAASIPATARSAPANSVTSGSSASVVHSTTSSAQIDADEQYARSLELEAQPSSGAAARA